MALEPRRHGLTILRRKSDSASVGVTSNTTWGVVVTGPAADADLFPLNTPVLVPNVQALLDEVGAVGATGTLPVVLKAINQHPRSSGVIVRVEVGAGEDAEDIETATNANVIAGLDALRLARQTLGVRPTILATPGLDTAVVQAALAVTLGKVKGIGYARAIGDTPAEVYAHRQTFSARELCLIDGDFLIGEEVSYATAHAVALRATIDRTEQAYSKTISNVAVPGVTGIVAPREWDYESADTEMGLINGADVTGLIQAEIGGGFRFWGNRTCSSDADYAFETAVLTDQALDRMITKVCFPWADQPLTVNMAKTLIEELNREFDRETPVRIAGARAYYSETNTAESLRAGKLFIGKRWMFYAPNEDTTIESWIDTTFLVEFAELRAAA